MGTKITHFCHVFRPRLSRIHNVITMPASKSFLIAFKVERKNIEKSDVASLSHPSGEREKKNAGKSSVIKSIACLAGESNMNIQHSRTSTTPALPAAASPSHRVAR